MPLDILIVSDKFKGTLTAQAAASLIAQGWRGVRPTDSLELLPMSDGGDGFGDVLAPLLNGKPRRTMTVDAAHRLCEAVWWWDPDRVTALVESARVIGLALLPPRQYHPFDLDTYGLGAVLQAAGEIGSRQILVGIGGSATNDAGFGAARSLGWNFLRSDGKAITHWTGLTNLAHIQSPPVPPNPAEIVVGVDVQNTLLGSTGASRVYGPQKGLRPEDFSLAEACLSRLAKVVLEDLGLDAAREPGTGAAGGLGFGLRCFLAARLESGFNLFARYARLEGRIASAGLVITGEGAIDGSTLMGKGVGEVARLCRKHQVPCLGLAGSLANELPADDGEKRFTKLYGIAPQLASVEEAKAAPQTWLPRLAAAAAKEW